MRSKYEVPYRVLNFILAFILVIGIFSICQYARRTSDQPVETDPMVPAIYLEAVDAAKYYAECINTSYVDMIHHLRSMGFEQDAAEYGADNCDVNWNEEAYAFFNVFIEYYTDEQLSGLVDIMELAGYTEENIGYVLYRYLSEKN